MNLGFDLDGVLHPWHEGVWKLLKGRGYIDSSFEQFWSNWTEWKENNRILFMNMVNDPLMYSTQAPYYGADKMLQELKDRGHKIWYITQRPSHLDFTTKAWAKRWKLPNYENLIRVETSKKKAVIEKEIDLFVEDAIRHAEELNGFTKVILVKRPYNVEVHDKFDTVDSVLEVTKYINGRSNND
jgi:hypothetical protein